MENTIQIVSMNCRGLNDKLKRRDVFKRIKEKHIHIACLQDTHINENMLKYVKEEWGLTAIFSHYSSNSRGTAVLFNNNFEYQLHKYKCDPNGNYVIIDMTLENFTRFTLVSIYGPNEDNPDFYRKIDEIIDDFENESVILCGDWNLVLNPQCDLFNYKNVKTTQTHAKQSYN